ncbi:MAG TPA: ChaN family lipoprotein [Terriglobales bacterium]|nr:ChaN family lipoprotein [Terriglobales bacterium]
MTVVYLPCLTHAAAQNRASFDAINLDTAVGLDKLAAQLAAKRVVFIGEIHNRYDHHLNQLAIIRRLHELKPDIAIGIEYLPRSTQPQVDNYIAGRTTEQEFLRAAAYYRNWGYDYRLYAPIFRYAREQHIPVVPLNVPNTLPSAVAKVGITGLSEEQARELPREREPADGAYRARLRAPFEAHGATKPGDFDHFVEAQLVWDEGMAEGAAAYLSANPARGLVILAGSGHVVFDSGIPKRLERRTHATYVTVINSGEAIEPGIADYILLSKLQHLPPAGVLGIIPEEKNGECQIGSLSPAGAAARAGLKKGDTLVTINDQNIGNTADVHLALWDKKPGDTVRIKIRRRRRFGGVSDRDFKFKLGGAGRSAEMP